MHRLRSTRSEGPVVSSPASNRQSSPRRWATRGVVAALGLMAMTAGGCCNVPPRTKGMSSKDAWEVYWEVYVDREWGDITFFPTPEFSWLVVEEEWNNEQMAKAEAEALASGVSSTAFKAVVDKLAQKMASDLLIELEGIEEINTDDMIHVVVAPLIAPELDPAHPASDQVVDQLEMALSSLADRLMENDDFKDSFKVYTSSFTDAQDVLDQLQSGVYNTGVERPLAGQILTVRPRVILSGMQVPPFSIEMSLRVTVNHPLTKTDVLSDRYEAKYSYHPWYERYLSQAENLHLKNHGKLPE